jgi:hypothetical protein
MGPLPAQREPAHVVSVQCNNYTSYKQGVNLVSCNNIRNVFINNQITSVSLNGVLANVVMVIVMIVGATLLLNKNTIA